MAGPANPPAVLAALAPLSAAAADWGAGGAITPGVGIFKPLRAIWVGVTGNITLTLGGVSVTLTNVPVGLLWVAPTSVTAATATGLVGLR